MSATWAFWWSQPSPLPSRGGPCAAGANPRIATRAEPPCLFPRFVTLLHRAGRIKCKSVTTEQRRTGRPPLPGGQRPRATGPGGQAATLVPCIDGTAAAAHHRPGSRPCGGPTLPIDSPTGAEQQTHSRCPRVDSFVGQAGRILPWPLRPCGGGRLTRAAHHRGGCAPSWVRRGRWLGFGVLARRQAPRRPRAVWLRRVAGPAPPWLGRSDPAPTWHRAVP